VERSAHAGLTVRKTEHGDVRQLPSAVELAALRIVQEAITNVVRHSGSTSATITLQYDAETLAVTVQDSGRGLARPDDAQAGMSGTGIVGMRERAEALGGSLQVGPGDAGGVRVQAVLPVQPSHSREER
jgi:signal transduction histidine kinase